MRSVFTSFVLAAFMAAAPAAADAGNNKTQKRSKAVALKPVVHKKSGDVALKILTHPVNCDAKMFAETSVRADMVFDLETGTMIHTNIPEDRHATTRVYPASLSKLESMKIIFDRIKAGVWSKTDTFEVRLPKPHAPVKMSLVDIVLASANPSLNVMDSIADESFLEEVRAHLLKIGALSTKFLSATGLPVTPAIRNGQVTTLADLKRIISDFEMNYARPKVAQEVLGIDHFTGIGKLDIPGIHRAHHTIKILQNAVGDGAKPYPHVVGGKSGYTCNFGFGSYVRYEETRPIIVFTAGHTTALGRDSHTIKLIEDYGKGPLRLPVPAAAPVAVPAPVPAVVYPDSAPPVLTSELIIPTP